MTALENEAAIRPRDLDAVRGAVQRSSQVLQDVEAVGQSMMDDSLRRLPGPVFVIGFLRTGSTLVHNLLSLHEVLHGPPLWELANPVELATTPQESWGALRDSAAQYVAEYYERAPDLPGIHHIDADLPDECHRLLGNTFQSMVLEMRYRVPSYGQWLHRQDLRPAYMMHRRQLALLMSAHSDENGRVPTPVLKCPFHTWFLPDLVHAYPRARFIHLHRDPVSVVASTASLCRTLRWARSDHLDLDEIGAQWAGRIGELSRQLADDRDGMLRGAPVLDLDYRQLMADPVAAMTAACRFLGIDPSPAYLADVSEYVRANPAAQRGTHRYTCEDFGLREASVRAATTDYQRRFLGRAEPR